MLSTLELREKLSEILSEMLGAYTFSSGQSTEAIAVLPDPNFGFDYPPTGTKVTGLEVVIIANSRIGNKPLLGSTLVDSSTQILLKQWDIKKTTVEAVSSIIDYLGSEIIEAKPRVLPVPGINSIEHCSVFIKNYSVRVFKG